MSLHLPNFPIGVLRTDDKREFRPMTSEYYARHCLKPEDVARMQAYRSIPSWRPR